MLHYQVQRIGSNRGAPRLWLQGLTLTRAGFTAGSRYSVRVTHLRLELEACEAGERIVSTRCRRDGHMPIVDLNSTKVLGEFGQLDSVRIRVMAPGHIVIDVTASERRYRERLHEAWTRLCHGESLLMGSVSHGGGIMSHALHRGFAQAGVDCYLRFANEVRAELVDHASIANEVWEEGTVALCAPLQELAFDAEVLTHLPSVDILEAGLPCSGASVSGRAKRGLSVPEAHPDVGHLVAGFLALAAHVNPLVILIENVTPYLNSGSAWILRNQLGDWGYDVHELVFRGSEFNAHEDRERVAMVAVTRGIAFDLAAVPRPEAKPMCLADVLDDVPPDSSRWSSMTGLKAKQVRDEAAGKGFRLQVFDGDSETIGTITKGYAKVRSTDPKLSHPDDPSLLRQLTSAEHARVKQIPEHLAAGVSETLAHELLGQSVIHGALVAIGEHVARALVSWAASTVRSAA